MDLWTEMNSKATDEGTSRRSNGDGFRLAPEKHQNRGAWSTNRFGVYLQHALANDSLWSNSNSLGKRTVALCRPNHHPNTKPLPKRQGKPHSKPNPFDHAIVPSECSSAQEAHADLRADRYAHDVSRECRQIDIVGPLDSLDSSLGKLPSCALDGVVQ